MAHELNEPQAAAVTHPAGPLLVFAGAGSGKTRVITYRVANLLAEHRVPPYRVLTVTFTNKAAAELRQRLAALAGEEVAADLWVGTFHSMCAKFLRRYHDEVGLDRHYSIYDDSDQKAVMARVLKDLGIDERQLPPKLALGRIHGEKREGRGPDDVEVFTALDQVVVDVFRRYQQALAAANAVDFEDLLLHVMRLVENPESPAGRELNGRFDHVLVDEFQDTNIVQYRLVRALSAQTRNLCVVGDDDQSIYRWRGADVRLIRGFQRDFPDATVVKLEQNYRSTGNIVRGALGMIEPSPRREPKALWTAAEAGDPIRVCARRDERDEAVFVMREIQAELARGTSADTIAVFYRVHAQSRVIEEALRNENVPYQVVGGMKFFERAEVKDALAYLRLIDNPRSDADLVRIINTPTRGIGNKTVQRLLDMAAARGTSCFDAIDATLATGGLGTASKKKLLAFQELVTGLRKLASEARPHQVAAAVLDETGYRKLLREDDSAESDARLENLEELLGSLQEFEQDAESSGEAPTLSGYLERVSLITAVDTMRDMPMVSLMTVHAAKGLEFDAVFLTGMEDEVFPYKGLSSEQLEELDEERRLAYVAVTRARQRLVMSYFGQRMLFGQTRYLAPSRFLGDLPAEVVQREGSAFGTRPRSSTAPTAPRLAPGERMVDREFFDDLPSDGPAVTVRRGARVRHQRFGEGQVERVEAGTEPMIVARFPGFGVRKVLARFLELA